jgi:hypothetical protein
MHDHPILYEICVSYEKFYGAFSNRFRNYKESYIFDNVAFRDTATGSKLNIQFFGNNLYDRHKESLRTLKFVNCFSDLGFKTLQEFREYGLPLTIATWMRLRNTLTAYLTNAREKSGPTITISHFVARWRKGGKHVRKYILAEIADTVNMRAMRSYLTFISLINVRPPDNFSLGVWYSTWNINSLTNDFRTFIYNLRFNCLPLNNRLNSYRPEIDPACTYCRMYNNPAPRDSLSHCFFYCPTVKIFLDEILDLAGFDNNMDEETLSKLFWYGYKDDQTWNQTHLVTMIIIFDAFRYVTFKNRQRKILPTSLNFKIELCNFLYWIGKFNKKIKLAYKLVLRGTILLQAIG